MTTFAYDQTAATALRLLQRFGAAATIKRETAGTYDPVTGTTPVTVTSLATTAAVFAYPQRYVDNSLILQGDQQAFLASTNEPKQGDKLTWAGRDLTVWSVKPLAPAGTAVLYELQVRG